MDHLLAEMRQIGARGCSAPGDWNRLCYITDQCHLHITAARGMQIRRLEILWMTVITVEAAYQEAALDHSEFFALR